MLREFLGKQPIWKATLGSTFLILLDFTICLFWRGPEHTFIGTFVVWIGSSCGILLSFSAKQYAACLNFCVLNATMFLGMSFLATIEASQNLPLVAGIIYSILILGIASFVKIKWLPLGWNSPFLDNYF